MIIAMSGEILHTFLISDQNFVPKFFDSAAEFTFITARKSNLRNFPFRRFGVLETL